MTVIAPVKAEPALRFDFSFLRRMLLYLAGLGLVLAPFTQDPLAIIVGGMVPYVLVSLVDRPAMPSAVIFILIWQWVQVAARLLIAFQDHESLADGVFGTDVVRAYWYSLASLVVIAVAFRVAFAGVRPAPQEYREQHLAWRPDALFWVYVASWVLALILGRAASISGGLAQIVGPVGYLKIVAMFVLFVVVISTGRGVNWLVAVVLLEVVTGFSGFFSDFKVVFYALILAALSVRVPLTPTSVLMLIGGMAALVVLALFWTAVKPEYRAMASGFAGTQELAAPIGERAAWLGAKAIAPGQIEWGEALNDFLRRVAYIDFFGASIGVADTAPEAGSYQRWSGALEHVFTPRLFFPDKAALNDTEVFALLARGDVEEISVVSSSISVGYMAENYVDFGFPGMLFSIFAMGLLLGGMARYFMTRPIAWAVREGFVLACIMIVGTGVELSLAKYLGGLLTGFAVLAICQKFLVPYVVRRVT